MKLSQLSKKDIKKILMDIPTAPVSKKDKAELLDNKIVLINGKPFFFINDGHYIPTLKLIFDKTTSLGLNYITVDKGAISFVIKGADIMRPGITKIDEGISIGDIVIIIDETHSKPLAIGKSLMDSDNLKSSTSGKVIKNLHYVGDEIWNIR